MVRAINDNKLVDTFNEIQEGNTDRSRLKRLLLPLIKVDEDQTMKNMNVLV